jgi:hypothetical protein
MDSNGNTKANFLSFITAPPKMAMAICGANPNTRNKDPVRINKPKANKSDLFIFIIFNLTGAKIMEETLRLCIF